MFVNNEFFFYASWYARVPFEHGGRTFEPGEYFDRVAHGVDEQQVRGMCVAGLLKVGPPPIAPLVQP